MVHLYGVASSTDSGYRDISSWTPVDPASSSNKHAKDSWAIVCDQIECSRNEILIWLVGDIYGIHRNNGESEEYTARPSSLDPIKFCRRQIGKHGTDVLSEFNGEFLLIVYDEKREDLHFVTDRLAAVPLYHTRSETGAFVFSTNIQDVVVHPNVQTGFHPDYLHEYLAFKHVIGVKTPFIGIEELHPGSITTLDLDTGLISTEVYWRPHYRPRYRSFEQVVDQFTTIFTKVIEEWIREDDEYGILLSGGSDSRLILATLGDRSTTLHMSDWANRENRTAKQVATIAGASFITLWRGEEYQIGSMNRNRSLSNFTGWFTQPFTSGMDDEINDHVDVLFSGLYADSLFKPFSIPTRDFSLGDLGTITLPVERSIDTISDYIDWQLESAHVNPELPTNLRTILADNIHRDGNKIINHGVTYDSIRDMTTFGSIYPLSNDDDLIFQLGLMRHCPYRTPYLDDRLLDLAETIPITDRLRKNLINRAVVRLNPDLAAVPHANTGIPLTWKFPVEFVGRNLVAAWRKHVHDERPPKPYMTNGSWINDSELLRGHDFMKWAIERYGNHTEITPGIDRETIEQYYRQHLKGENRHVELYTIMTVLSMPATEYLNSGMELVPHSSQVP